MGRWSHNARRTLALGGGVLAILTACGGDIDDTDDQADAQSDTQGDEKADWPDPFVYGILPTEDVEELLETWEPIGDYLSECLDHPVELFGGTNYTAMIEAMRTGNLQMSRFGPFSYILANERAGADTLVMGVSDPSEVTYRSQIITLASTGIESLEDLEGQSFAWVDPASTSGYLFPRAMLIEELGVSNDEIDDWLGEVTNSGNHDASVLSVLNGDVAAAALASNNPVWDGGFDDHENIDELEVVAETKDIPRTVEAIQRDLPDSLKDAVETCLLDASEAPAMDEFFAEGELTTFIAADDSAFDVIRETADALGMGPDDLLED